MGVSPIEAVLVASVLFVLWAVIDAAVRPLEEWDAIGYSKPVWLVVQIAGLLLFGIPGATLSLYYAFFLRRRLRHRRPNAAPASRRAHSLRTH